MTKVFMFLFRILVGSIGVFLSGYIFKTGWNWFFATAYNLPMATLKAGVGFSMLLSLAAFGVNKYRFLEIAKASVKKESPKTSDDTTEAVFAVFVVAILLPLFLGELWIYNLVLGDQ